MGVDVRRVKIAAFTASAFLAGVSGALYASYLSFAQPGEWSLLLSIQFIAAIIVGGMGTVAGPLLGSAVVFALPTVLKNLPFLPEEGTGGVSVSDLSSIAYGLLIVAFLVLEPRGLVGLAERAGPLRRLQARTVRLRQPTRGGSLVRRSSILAVAAVAATSLALGACGTGDAGETSAAAPPRARSRPGPGVDAAAKTIRVGDLNALSGPAAALGKPVAAGHKAFFDALNARGGIDGWKVKLAVEDTGYQPQQHVQAYNQLKGDIAILNSFGSPTTKAIQPQFQREKLVTIPASFDSIWGTDPTVAPVGHAVQHRRRQRARLRDRRRREEAQDRDHLPERRVRSRRPARLRGRQGRRSGSPTPAASPTSPATPTSRPRCRSSRPPARRPSSSPRCRARPARSSAPPRRSASRRSGSSRGRRTSSS